MNIAHLKKSRFLTKEDVGEGKLVTVKGDVTQENVAMDNQPEDMKFIIQFNELEKGMVLNTINAQLMAKITGSDDTENWDGKQVVLYHDPSVVFGGKLVGGIRIRAARNRPAIPAKAKAAAAPVVDDGGENEVPF